MILFLRRKNKKTEFAEHYNNRVQDFFEGDTEANKIRYKDDYLLEEYCQYIQIPYEKYIGLLEDAKGINELLEYDIFKDYQQNFAKSTEIKNLKRKSIFNKKTPEEQKQEIQKRWIEFVQEKEKEKLFYFILTKTQNNPVLIVKAPQGKQAEEKFLGYKWSGKKGYEGIKYLNGETVHNIRTPLFDPQNLETEKNKINVAIKNNFIGKIINPLPQHCQMASLTDLIHFDKTTFDKVISLNPKKILILKRSGTW